MKRITANIRKKRKEIGEDSRLTTSCSSIATIPGISFFIPMPRINREEPSKMPTIRDLIISLSHHAADL
ncbi:MAG: hypothetical protein IJQ02_06925 [Oscillospiraceae bacterium]|nr:hypothetical protein [Oscillospiraceae bacterium]